jgi:hypothetical protein
VVHQTTSAPEFSLDLGQFTLNTQSWSLPAPPAPKGKGRPAGSKASPGTAAGGKGKGKGKGKKKDADDLESMINEIDAEEEGDDLAVQLRNIANYGMVGFYDGDVSRWYYVFFSDETNTSLLAFIRWVVLGFVSGAQDENDEYFKLTIVEKAFSYEQVAGFLKSPDPRGGDGDDYEPVYRAMNQSVNWMHFLSSIRGNLTEKDFLQVEPYVARDARELISDDQYIEFIKSILLSESNQNQFVSNDTEFEEDVKGLLEEH